MLCWFWWDSDLCIRELKSPGTPPAQIGHSVSVIIGQHTYIHMESCYLSSEELEWAGNHWWLISRHRSRKQGQGPLESTGGAPAHVGLCRCKVHNPGIPCEAAAVTAKNGG